MGSTQSTWGDRKVLKTKINMPRGGEICFEAPEINMASDIVLDARVSIVTVAKLVDVSVKGRCKCPDVSNPDWKKETWEPKSHFDTYNINMGDVKPTINIG